MKPAKAHRHRLIYLEAKPLPVASKGLSPSGKAVQLAYQDPLLNNIKTGAAAWSVQLSTELINDRQVYPAG